MSEPKTESLRVVVTLSMRQALRAVAERHDVPEAQLIRQAIRNYLKEQGA